MTGDGYVEAFSFDKLVDTIERLTPDCRDDIEVDQLVKELARNIFDGIKTEELERALLLSASSFIERDPASYDKLSTRLFLQRLYREVSDKSVAAEERDEDYRAAFLSHIATGVEEGHFSAKLLDFDLDALSEMLHTDRDDLFGLVGIQTLYERYFVRVRNRIVETPQAFWMRVAMGLALREADRTTRAVQFYEVLSTLRFVASTAAANDAERRAPTSRPGTWTLKIFWISGGTRETSAAEPTT